MDEYFITKSILMFHEGTYFITKREGTKPFHMNGDGTWQLKTCDNYYSSELEAAAAFQKYYPDLELKEYAHTQLWKLEWTLD